MHSSFHATYGQNQRRKRAKDDTLQLHDLTRGRKEIAARDRIRPECERLAAAEGAALAAFIGLV